MLRANMEEGRRREMKLYDSEEKQLEIAESIGGKVEEIEDYVNQIIRASKEDFLELTVEQGECYVKDLLENICGYYEEKLSLTGSRFLVKEYEEDCCLITVKNSGAALPPSELSHIFESFWRGSNAGKKPGSGMGLYICKQIMHQMLGEIYASIEDGKMAVTCVFRKA